MTALGSLTVDALLEELAAPAPAAAGASASALTAAMAASLAAMVARGTSTWMEGDDVATQATELRARLVALAEEDAAAVAGLLEILRRKAHGHALALGLIDASRPPVAIAEAAAEVARLADSAAENGKRVMRVDAAVAAVLARAAVRSAVTVAETNLAAVPPDAGGGEPATLLGRLASLSDAGGELAPPR